MGPERIDEIKRELQGFLGDGLTIIVGSGLSRAEGIPGMSELAAELCKIDLDSLGQADRPVWEKIAAELQGGKGLEEVLHSIQTSADLNEIIRIATAKYIRFSEEDRIRAVYADGRELRLSKLLRRCLRPAEGITVVTTNYDRLIETAADRTGLGVDSLFAGSVVKELDPQSSRHSLCTGVTQVGKRVTRKFRDYVLVLKPHGSLDWYLSVAGPVQTQIVLNESPMIITPGINKYRDGYDSPFDVHREIANRRIKNSSRYIILGYGFNDDHLEAHLVPQIKSGRPTLVLTHSLSKSCLRIIEDASGMICLSHDVSNGTEGTLVSRKGKTERLEAVRWWDLEEFSREVLGI